MKRALVTAWLAGFVFGVGLVISGMTTPANVQGFLDFAGSFRPALALVMAAAVLVYAVAIRLPPKSRVVSLAPRAGLDRRLIIGSAVFGIGWGLGGYCPGPSIVAAGAGRLDAIVFVACSSIGILCADALRAPTEPRSDHAPATYETTSER
ncbi:MAG TPA: DUF6691 family protein [Polyangiaceae bacterium]|nr:DUF6691 family protein [Polyangiaceae bacterium]